MRTTGNHSFARLVVSAALALAGCGAPEVGDGEEWVDSSTQEIACSPTPRLVALDPSSGALVRFRTEDGAATLDGTIGGRVWADGDRLISDLNGRFYAIDAQGALWLVRTNTNGVVESDAEQIAEGWGGYRTVLSGGDGVLYAIDEAGALHWFRHFDSETGDTMWADESGQVIKDGFGAFTQVVSGGDGVIYTLEADGTLRWFLHLDPDDGAAEWAPDSGAVIASGLALTALTSAGDGLLFGTTADGDVHLYQHDDPVNGTPGFAEGAGRVIAHLQTEGAIAAYTPSCDGDAIALRAALVHWGMFPAASDAYRTLGLSSSRIVQTIGNAAASAGYHARDGYANGQPYSAATDISTSGLSRTFIHRLLERMGRVGFAAFYRWPGHDGWPYGQAYHIHAVYAGCKMKSQLRGQVTDWLNGRDGLAYHGRYTFFTPSATAKAKVRNLFNGGPTTTTGGGGGGGGNGGSCVSGGFYCGGDKVSGNSSTLYRCTGGGNASVVSRCANGCAVNAGRDDSCRTPTACVKGGSYCGGDKINGHPATLYRCNGASAPSVIKRCANACVVSPGSDDYCR